MAAMTKIVNIRTRVAVRNVNPPICGTVKGIVMTTGDILKCLCKRAQVEEVLPNGTTVKLNMSNYYTDNGAGLDAKKNIPAPEKKHVEDIERFKVPVSPVEETEKQVVETKTEEEKVTELEAVPEIVEETAEEKETVFVTSMSVEGDTTDANAETTTTVTTDVTVDDESTPATVNNNSKKNKKKK